MPPFLNAPPWGLLLGLVLVGGCRQTTSAGDLPLHWPTQPAPPLRGPNPQIWVALADRLPAPAGVGGPGLSLELRAATGRLRLRDGAGLDKQADQFEIRWLREPLPQPFVLERQVIGPFPSYESAAEQARLWRLKGASPVVARPGEWEVWAPLASPPPDGPVRQERQEHQQRWRPALVSKAAAAPLPLQGPVRLEAPGGLLWQGVRYPGPFRLQADAYGSWTLVEQLPMETYLGGVVPHEIGAGAPPAALGAQAVLARTWAVANQRRFQVDGYHLCADTQCQVYSDPTQAGSEVRGALQRSAGQVLTWKGAPLAGVYSASNGGVAAGFEEGWRGQALPYLRAFVDGPPPQQKLFPLPLAGEAPLGKLLREGGEFYGQGHPRYRWQRRLRAAELTALTAPEAIGPIKDLVVAQRGPSGRVQELVLVGAAGELRLQRDQIRRRLRMLPSTLFVLAPEGPGVWLLEGGGFGHGAGLSQAGAIDLAQRGWGSDRILQHYFPGSSLRPLKTLQPQGSP